MDNHSPSIASTAASFLSTCGSARRPPECSTQRSPIPTPQVGQGTDDNCSGVSSFFFTRTECKNACRKTVQLGTLFELVAAPVGAEGLGTVSGSTNRAGRRLGGNCRCGSCRSWLYEAHLAEFVHKKIDSRAGGADHLRKRLLRHFGQ
jgi:hypothetical protein